MLLRVTSKALISFKCPRTLTTRDINRQTTRLSQLILEEEDSSSLTPNGLDEETHLQSDTLRVSLLTLADSSSSFRNGSGSKSVLSKVSSSSRNGQSLRVSRMGTTSSSDLNELCSNQRRRRTCSIRSVASSKLKKCRNLDLKKKKKKWTRKKCGD